MDSNQKISKSLKIYWQKAVKRRVRLSNIMKGENNPAKSIIVRKKISKSKRGKRFKHIHPLSLRQRKHLLYLAKLRKGKKLNLETRIKISMSRKGKCKGQDNPFYGRHHTKISIKKIKRAHQFRRSMHLQTIFKKANVLGFNIKANLKQSEMVNKLQNYNYNGVDSLGYIIGTIPTDAYFDMPPTKDSYVYSISAKDKDFIESIIDCFNNVCRFKPNLNRYRNLFRIQTSKKQIEQFLRFVKKENESQWIFSEDIFDLDRDFHRSILRAVSDAEGCVTHANSKQNIISRQITITNSSLLLLKQIKLLLESFGIHSYIYHHIGPRITKIRGEKCQFMKHVFVLIITGYQNLHRFKNIIGFSIKRKQYKLENILGSYKKIGHSYTKEQYELVLKLAKYFSNCCDISKLINIPPYTVRNWVLYNRRPRSTKMAKSI